MRECVYEKNVNFNESYRKQRSVITSQIVRAVNIKLIFFWVLFFIAPATCRMGIRREILLANHWISWRSKIANVTRQ